MENGDISNEVVPRLVLTFENLLGLLPDKKAEAKAYTYARMGWWKRAIAVFEINELLARKIWDVTWRLNFQVDVITFISPEAAKQIEQRLLDEDLPIRRVWYADKTKLARQISYMPDLAAIYHADPELQLTFGSKGRFLSPAEAHLFGTF